MASRKRSMSNSISDISDESAQDEGPSFHPTPKSRLPPPKPGVRPPVSSRSRSSISEDEEEEQPIRPPPRRTSRPSPESNARRSNARMESESSSDEKASPPSRSRLGIGGGYNKNLDYSTERPKKITPDFSDRPVKNLTAPGSKKRPDYMDSSFDNGPIMSPSKHQIVPAGTRRSSGSPRSSPPASAPTRPSPLANEPHGAPCAVYQTVPVVQGGAQPSIRIVTGGHAVDQHYTTTQQYTSQMGHSGMLGHESRSMGYHPGHPGLTPGLSTHGGGGYPSQYGVNPLAPPQYGDFSYPSHDPHMQHTRPSVGFGGFDPSSAYAAGYGSDPYDPYGMGATVQQHNGINYVHIPVFRVKKNVRIKRQPKGCCGCLNCCALCDFPHGLLSVLNPWGWFDREEVYKVDAMGNILKKKGRH